jgi:hypothetical protein
MSTNKAIQGLQKQNDSIYTSLVAKNIQFDRIVISDGTDEQEQLRLLNEENAKLKEVVKTNKPPPQPKEVKPIVPKQEAKPAESKPKEKKEDDEEEETYDEPVKKFDTINFFFT